MKNELENWLGEYYDQVYVAATSNISYYNRRLMVKNGLGVATCHEFSDVDPDLSIRLLSPEISNGSVLVWKREQVLSPAVRKFVEFAKQKLQQGDMQNVHTEE